MEVDIIATMLQIEPLFTIFPSPVVWLYFHTTLALWRAECTLVFGLNHVIHFGQRNGWVCSLASLPLSWEEHISIAQ